ncbi:MAG: phosphoglucosamine mutase [Candidatus Thorarchaeota archaeon]|nr:phosphoglucosamine mutase [Candidatus Thorarchaeota archaeon]
MGKKLFGTNGVRGITNREITPEIALNIGKAVGTVLEGEEVAVGRDSRMGGEMLQHAVTSGLLSAGKSVVDVGFVPTPTLQFIIPELGCTGGIVITASHNPPEFNGLKVMGSNGIEVSRDLEDEMEEIYFNEDFKLANWTEIGSKRSYDSAIDDYLQAIKSHVDIEAVKKQGLKVVVDGANSVGSLATPILLRQIGCKVISLNAQMDGLFPGRDPEPTPENLKMLAAAVKAVGADFGIAHDGDADRATFVDENGTILWGDQSFAIMASYILADYENPTLVTPVSSGRLIEDVAEEAGATIDWTVVGSVDVSHRMMEIDAEMGGEENGGVFYPEHQAVRDGAMTAAKMAEIMAVENKTLSELVADLPQYKSVKLAVDVPQEKKVDILEPLLKLTKDEKRITIDGVKLIYDEGWVLMRPSGTEPIWRCFAESETEETAEKLAEKGKNMILKALATLE